MNDKTIEKEAIKWSIALSGDDVDKRVIDAFYAWREQSPEHEAIFQKVDRVWLGMSNMAHIKSLDTQKQPVDSWWDKLNQKIQSWFSVPVMAGAAISMSVLFALVLTFKAPQIGGENAPALVQVFETPHASVKTFLLDDGSQVTLGAESKIKVVYNSHYREVSLLKGEALFDVEHNKDLPFIVNSGDTQTRVLGTTFLVKRNADSVQVAVKEGKVGVGIMPSETKVMKVQDLGAQLIAGQMVTSNKRGDVGAISSVDIDSIASWQSGRLVYESALLKTVVADMNRYSDIEIMIASDKIAALEVSIAFDVGDIEETLETIALVLDIKINKGLSGTILIQEK
jgi:transmembrane sensor